MLICLERLHVKRAGLGLRDGVRGGSPIVRRHRGERRGPRRALHRPKSGQYCLGLRDGLAPGAAPARRRRAGGGAPGGRVQAPRVSEHGNKVAASLIVCHLTPPPRRRPGPSRRVLGTTASTPDYKSSSSTTLRARPISDSIGSRTKVYRTSRGRSRPPAKPRDTRNCSAPSRAKRRRAWPSSSPRASRI